MNDDEEDLPRSSVALTGRLSDRLAGRSGAGARGTAPPA